MRDGNRDVTRSGKEAIATAAHQLMCYRLGRARGLEEDFGIAYGAIHIEVGVDAGVLPRCCAHSSCNDVGGFVRFECTRDVNPGRNFLDTHT